MKSKMPEMKDVTEVVTCRAGKDGCPMAVIDVAVLADKLADILDEPETRRKLEEKLAGPFVFHSRFCAAVTGCPNACARPQIRDFGVIGRARVLLDESLCNECGMCEDACREDAIALIDGKPRIDETRCIGCSDCVRSCQSDALLVDGQRHEVIAGGKLGRHPRLARSLGEFETVEDAVECLRRAILLLLEEGRRGERFGALLERLESEE